MEKIPLWEKMMATFFKKWMEKNSVKKEKENLETIKNDKVEEKQEKKYV